MTELDFQNEMFGAILKRDEDHIDFLLEYGIVPNRDCINQACRMGLEILIPQEPDIDQIKLTISSGNLSTMKKHMSFKNIDKLFAHCCQFSYIEAMEILWKAGAGLREVDYLENKEILNLLKVIYKNR